MVGKSGGREITEKASALIQGRHESDVLDQD